MTQASGILSSAHADEGVPQSHHGDSNKIETGAERHSLPNCSSIVVPQHEPGDYSVTAKVATAAGVLTRGIGSPDSPAAPFSRFIVRLNPLVYLRSYDDDGSFPTTKLDQAKLFASLDTAQGIADLLHGDVRRVIVNHREILLALTERRCADTGAKDNSAFDTKADASAERADGDEVPPSSTRSSIPSDAKKLFLE